MKVDTGIGCSIGDKLTLLSHKGVVESATYHHKKGGLRRFDDTF
jgi:hypothetical protein